MLKFFQLLKMRTRGLKSKVLPVMLLLTLLMIAGCGKQGIVLDEASNAVITAGDNENLKRLDKEIKNRLVLDLLTPNEFSRAQEPLTEIKGIVVHYVGNPDTTAKENRDYFESLKDTEETYASSHFIIDSNGQIMQLTPLDEIAYCSNERNADTISIETCHVDETGVFTDEAYDSLVKLCAYLCEYYGLEYTDVIRHFDVTEKLCPKAFALDPEYWYTFKSDVANELMVEITAEELMKNGTDAFYQGDEE